MSMTGAIRGASSKVLREEVDGAVLDHLRNHVHLTNCIHLKNHMHKHSPMSAESSLIRDLAVLQRSRSLRDPSTSPSWHSPTIESLAKKLEQEGSIQGPRRSIGFERRRELWRGSTSSPPIPGLVTSKVSDRARIAAAESLKENDKVDSVGVESTVSRVRDGRRNKGEESSRKSLRNEPQFGSLLGSGLNPLRDVHDSARGEIIRPVDYLVPGKAVSKDKSILQKGNHGKSVYRESLSGLSLDNRDMESSSFHHRGRYIREGKTREEPEASIQHNCNERSSLGGDLNRVNKRKFKGIRGARASIGPRNVGAQNELSVASNSLVQGASDLKYYPELQGMEGGGEHPKLEVSQAHRNGCGIPWNWSRIHDRGKTFLDMAGRSFSCGMSDSRLRKGEGPIPPGCSGSQRDVPDMPVASEYSSSPVKSDSEVLPLLIEPSGSRDSTETANWARDYSGELGIYADHNLRHNHDSDLASETRSGDQRNSRGYLRGRQRLQLGERHRSLTQKYMPTTLKDLVGQNLVSQALCNAVMKRKVGLLYVFYGPHGTGKTSCARIFAKALNCQCPEHPRPCGVCSCCIAHDLGKSRNVREVGPVSNLDFESSMNLFENMIISQPSSSQYRVLIVDDCDTLPTDSWSAISKVIDRAPRRVVFILISSSLDHLPHVIISRGQKFFFPKLKDADIIYTLQWIATKEDLEIDKDALKLIASRSDGSLRDAEMTLDQLSLLGQRISLALVQELVGLISDEKLVDLLDLALSADTVNTVKSLREIMEAGVEPLALMSQLATIITDILAGSYVFTRERLRRKFFRRPTLSKEDMERLRQALKTLSEAEKQLRTSNDRLTWLTAALLQLAPDRNYMLPSSSADTSFSQSPMALNYTNERDLPRKYNADHAEAPNRGRGLSPCIKMDDLNVGSVSDAIYTEVKMKGNYIGGNINAPRSSTVSTDITKVSGGQFPGKGHKEIEQLWESVLEKFQSNTLKQFMRQEGKLMSVSFGADPTVQLMLGSQVSKSKAEKFRGKILQAFESVFESPVTIEIRCEPRKDTREHLQDPLALPDAEKDAVQPIMMSIANDRVRAGFEHQLKRLSKDRVINGTSSMQATRLRFASPEISKSEIVEVMASPHVCEGRECMGNIPQSDEKDLESAWVEEATSSYHHATSGPLPERKRKVREQPQTQSLVKNRISLAHVIKQTEGCTQRSGWSKRKAISIAEKLEQENLRLEPRSRSLLGWKASRVTRGKLPRLRTRMRKPRSLLKLFPCSRCLSAKSPRGDFRWKLSTGNICRPWFSMLQGRGGYHASVGGSCLTIPCIHI